MKHLLLLGAGHAHVHVLSRLAQAAKRAPLPFRVTLVAPYPQQVYSGMLPGHVAGHYSLQQCTIELGERLQASGVQYLPGRGRHIDAARNIVVVGPKDMGQSLQYDLLSVNTGPVLDRASVEHLMPGAKAHALFLRPIEAFSPLWERLLQLAAKRALHIAVIGAGAAGVELAFAIRHRLGHCAVTLVCAGATPLANYPEGVRERVLPLLKARGITVLPQACTAISADHIVLDGVTRMACDAPILALGAQAPSWLGASGLALDPAGFIAVNAFAQSTSHPMVFAAGDVATRVDAPHPKSGVYAVRAAPALATNLLAALSGLPLLPHTPPATTLNLLACGARYAVASRGQWSAQGRWIWYWKDWIDRRFMARACRPG
ncbi:MAG: FAD-dependent oxidoreductase [Betaproteobacteria bacterium]